RSGERAQIIPDLLRPRAVPVATVSERRERFSRYNLVVSRPDVPARRIDDTWILVGSEPTAPSRVGVVPASRQVRIVSLPAGDPTRYGPPDVAGRVGDNDVLGRNAARCRDIERLAYAPGALERDELQVSGRRIMGDPMDGDGTIAMVARNRAPHAP